MDYYTYCLSQEDAMIVVDGKQASCRRLRDGGGPYSCLTHFTYRRAARSHQSRNLQRAVDHGLNGDMMAAFDLISSHIALAKQGPDHAKAMRAFREKRDGDYRDY